MDETKANALKTDVRTLTLAATQVIGQIERLCGDDPGSWHPETRSLYTMAMLAHLGGKAWLATSQEEG